MSAQEPQESFKESRWLWRGLGLKIVLAFLGCFVGFFHPHIIHQIDTMGISQRYAIQWQHPVEGQNPLWPRTLAAGDTNGILSMEFPLLNLVTAPLFMLPIEWARPVARCFHLFLILGLWFWSFQIWRRHQIFGISGKWPALLLLVMPISGLYLNRFMPDESAFFLCLIALGLSWEKDRPLSSFGLAAMGLLIKPPTVIVFAPLILIPPRRWWRLALWLLPAIGLSSLYYTLGIRWLDSMSSLPPYVKTGLSSPWSNVMNFIHQPLGVGDFILNDLLFPLAPLILGGGIAVSLWKKAGTRPKDYFKAWGVLILQVVILVILDGEHALVHRYYFTGISLVAAAIIVLSFDFFRNSKIWITVLLLPLVIYNLEHAFYDLRNYWQHAPDSVESLWRDCDHLREIHKDWPWRSGYAFRAADSRIQELGFCFGEIQGSQTTKYGFYKSNQDVPADCKIIDQSGLIRLVECR